MKVAIIGGSGVFGSRLARLLANDGHDLILAARSGVPDLARELGARSLELDLTGDLDPLFAEDLDVVIDAAGPFQSYGQDGLRLLDACLAARVHYLDFSDHAGFCNRVASRDAAAKAAGIVALTGASTVPALSAAAVRSLAADLDEITSIESALLPGNKAPRGKAVMRAILAQIGKPLRIWRGGAWQERYGWSEPRLYRLPGGVKRRAWLIGAPDLELFADEFGAANVEFRAGLELGVMGWSLDLLARLRQIVPLPIPFAPAYWGAGLLAPFGTDRGGMIVEVTGKGAEGWQRHSWQLYARSGDGPSVPAIAARAVLKQLAELPSGARPLLCELTLEEIEAAMVDLDIRFTRETEAIEPLFEAALGDTFYALAPVVQDSHQTIAAHRLHGTARVTRGTGWWPGLIARFFGFPGSGEDVPVQVLKRRIGVRELWLRSFGGATFRSDLGIEQGQMTERFGPFTFRIGLHAEEGRLYYPVAGGRLGPIPLPKLFWPRSDAVEYQDEVGAFRFDVALYAPITGSFIVRYEGRLEALQAANPAPQALARSA